MLGFCLTSNDKDVEILKSAVASPVRGSCSRLWGTKSALEGQEERE